MAASLLKGMGTLLSESALDICLAAAASSGSSSRYFLTSAEVSSLTSPARYIGNRSKITLLVTSFMVSPSSNAARITTFEHDGLLLSPRLRITVGRARFQGTAGHIERA